MTEKFLEIEVVSAEDRVFSGKAILVAITGEMGELGITPGHMPLLTKMIPGNIRVLSPEGQTDVFYISGGLLEVQPDRITVLADSAERADNLDEAKILEAEKKARDSLASQQQSELDYSKAMADLAQAVAQLQALKHTREKMQTVKT